MLIIIGAHHKVGTSLGTKIFKKIADYLNLKFYKGDQSGLPKGTDIWFEPHSKIDFLKITDDFRCLHFIRNPYQVTISAYHYHLICDEEWCLIRRNNQLSYQEKLKQLDPILGLNLEIEHSYRNLMEMYHWNYDHNPKILNVKFEDIMANYQEILNKILTFLQFKISSIPELIKLIKEFDINSLPESQIQENLHITNKKLKWDSYQEIYHPINVAYFKEIYPSDLFDKIGYQDYFAAT